VTSVTAAPFPLSAYEYRDPTDNHPEVVRVDSQQSLTERAIQGAQHRHGNTEISISTALLMEPIPVRRPAPLYYDVQSAGQPSLGMVFDQAVQRQLRNTLPAAAKRSWCVIL
jgi:hypothetical protein